MIPGTPLLAIYDATGVIRSFELAAGVFTQIASQGGFTHTTTPDGGPVPFMGWVGDRIVLGRSTGAGTGRVIELLDILLSTTATLNQNTTGSSAKYRVGLARDAQIVSIIPGGASNGTVRKHRIIGDAFFIESHDPFTNVGDLTDVPVTPDGTKWPWLTGTSIKDVRNPGANQNFEYEGVVTTRATIGSWDASNNYLITGTPGDTFATVHRFNAADAPGFEETYRIDDVEGTLVDICAAPYGKMLAIGWLIGAAYVTRIYRRQGGFYQLLHTLTAMGRTLDFTANGDILIDAISRKCAVYDAEDNVYVNNTGMAANLPAGTVRQAVSDHAPLVLSTAAMYQSGLELVAAGFDPFGDLKLTIATADAPAFDVTHDTLAETLGTAEVTNGGWPAGGISVENVVLVPGSGVVNVQFDSPERIMILSSAVFRYAVLHQDGVPVMRFDFQQDIAVAQNAKAVFEVPAEGVIQLSI